MFTKTTNTSSVASTGFTPDSHYQLRLVATFALITSVVSTCALVLALYILTGNEENISYFTFIKATSISKDLLPKTIIIAGLLTISIVGILTWLISVYSSARISGPLYRFSRNIELTIQDQAAPHIKIRKYDKLHVEASLLETALRNTHQHHQDLIQIAREIDQTINHKAGDQKILHSQIIELKSQEGRVRLDAQ